MKRLTAEWVRKAEADYRGARSLARKTPPLHDLVCFLCQQSAEKYLKAVLEELGLPVPHTHNLELLLNDLLPTYPKLRPVRRGAIFLTQFAVSPRYPGFKSTRRQAAASLRWAGRIRAACGAILGFKFP